MRGLKLISTVAAALGIAASACASAGAAAHAGPTGQGGARVRAIATGVPTPTSFAFAGHTVFVGAFGKQDGTRGGIYVVHHGSATLVPGTGPVVYGLAWHQGVLYASAGGQLVAYSGWNGNTFAQSQPIFTGVSDFSGFGGLAWGPDGRIYAGVLNPQGAADHANTGAPYLFDVLSLRPDGSDLRVVSRGLRQPFQLAFVPGIAGPFVSDLGQDRGARNPPDYIVIARPGSDFGFPACNWVDARKCGGFAKPFKLLSPHTDPMGIAAIGRTLYVAEFGGPGGNRPQVVAMSSKTGRTTRVAGGFRAPVIALGTNAGSVYTGDEAGTIYSIKP